MTAKTAPPLPAPRAREQLRRLRSPQIEAVCDIFKVAATMAPPESAALLRAGAERTRGACDALASLKRVLPAEPKRVAPEEGAAKEERSAVQVLAQQLSAEHPDEPQVEPQLVEAKSAARDLEVRLAAAAAEGVAAFLSLRIRGNRGGSGG